MTTRDYTCEQRHTDDQSAWSRSNLWVHEETISNSLTYQGVTDDVYTLDRYRAVRPIVEYKFGLEKYDFGLRHLLNVDHSLEDKIDPATKIEGQSSYNLYPGNYVAEWSSKGYAFGDKVKVTSGASTNQNITYWECVEAHGDIRKPTHGENKAYWEQVVPVELENGDFILFLEATNDTYKDKIFEVFGVGSSINLQVRYNFDGTNGATQVSNNDKIVILNGYNFVHNSPDDIAGGLSDRSHPHSGAELYWNGTRWDYGQQKQHRSQSFRVNLYDADLVILDNIQKYPNSDCFGATVFDFAHSETCLLYTSPSPRDS